MCFRTSSALMLHEVFFEGTFTEVCLIPFAFLAFDCPKISKKSPGTFSLTLEVY